MRPTVTRSADLVAGGFIASFIGQAICVVGALIAEPLVLALGAAVWLPGSISLAVGAFRMAWNVDVAAETVYVQVSGSPATDPDETSR